MRVVLYHNVVAPYRHALFADLARHVDLEVWYSTTLTRDRKWSASVPDGYRHRVLDGLVAHAFGRPLIACTSLVRDLRAYAPDAVVAVLTRSNAIDVLRICRWGRKAGVPVVLWVGATEPPADLRTGVPGPVDRVFEWYHSRALGAASGCLYYSEASRAWAERRGARGPSIVGTQVFAPPPLAPRLAPAPSDAPITALFVGKLEGRKGFDLLCDALERLPADAPPLRLRVAGEGPLAGRCADARIEHLGHLSRERLWDAYRDADFVVVPSRHDPWGNVVNEAMSLGTPVLATRQAGAAALARHGGWVVDAPETEPLAAGLVQAMRECRQPGRRGAAVAAEAAYRPGPCAERIARLLTSLRAGEEHDATAR